MRELDKVLNEDEKVFWEGKPVFWPFYASKSVVMVCLGFLIILLLLPGFIISIFMPGSELAYSSPSLFMISFAPFFIIGLCFVIITLIYNGLSYKNTYYAITNKRVIVQRGVIGRDFEIVDFDKITHAEVEVGFLDKLFAKDTGTIKISNPSTAFLQTTGQYVVNQARLQHIAKPYDVFKSFKKVSYDIKTDVEFPNAYRPKTNPGYGTQYKPDKKK